MKSRKAQYSIWIIVFAVLAILVLVIFSIFIITGTSKVSKGLADCKNKGGRDCINISEESCREGEIPGAGICKEGYICCIPVS